MSAHTRWYVIALAAGLVSGPLPSGAAPVPVDVNQSGLTLVPAQAPVVFHLHGVERTKERITAVLARAVPDFAPIITGYIDNLLQSGLEGRTLKGLIKGGSVVVALLEIPTPNVESPAFAVIARVTGYAEFRDGVLNEDERRNLKPDPAGFEHTQTNGKDVYFVDRKDFAVLTPSKDVATLIAKKPESLAERLNPEVARGLLGSDAAVYVNLSAVNKEYGDQIKQFRQFTETMIDAMPVGGATEKASMEMAKKLYGGVFQVIEDGRAVVLGLDFRPEGVNLHLQAHVGPTTKTNAILNDLKPGALAELATLPAGHTVYSAMDFGPTLFKTMAPLIYNMVGGDTEAQKKLQAALDEFVAAGMTTSLSAANVPPMGIEVMTFRDPAKAAAAHLQLFRALGEGATFQTAHIKGKPEIKENAQDYQGFKLHHVTMTWDLDKTAEALPGGGDAMKTAVKKMLGDGVKVWFGTDGRRYVVVNASDWDAARARLDRYLAGRATLAQDSAFPATRQQLPAEATLLFLADAGRFTSVMVDYLLSIVKAVPGLPLNLPNELKPVTTEVSYIGAAIVLKSEHGSFDLFVPVTGMVEMRKVITPLFRGAAE